MNIQKKIHKFEAIEVSSEMAGKMKDLLDLLGGLPPNVDIDRVMSPIYSVVDDFMRTVVEPFLPSCRKGCCYCCYVPVEVTLFEADYITKMTGIPAYRGVLIDKKGPCPFLTDSCCTIYNYRPLPCRMFGSFDGVGPCRDDNNHWLFTLQSSDFWFKIIYLNIVKNSLEASKTDTALTESHKDIRDWFQEGPRQKI